MEVSVIAPNHGGDPLGAILGPMGSHWVKKMGQNVKNYHAPKFEVSTTCRSSIFHKKMVFTDMQPNHCGDTLGAILGPMGSHWVLKMGQNRIKLPCRKIRIFDCPAVIHFPQKNGSYSYSAKSRWGPPRVHLGANGVPLGLKNGSKRKKLPCPKIRIFDYPAVIDFSQKMEFTDMQPNHCGDTLGAILGPIGSHWMQKMGQNCKNYHAPKFEFSTTPRSSIFRKKWKLRLWRQITVGTP